MPTIEQPTAAQKFSAQELLEALRPVRNETILPSALDCSKVGMEKGIERSAEERLLPRNTPYGGE